MRKRDLIALLAAAPMAALAQPATAPAAPPSPSPSDPPLVTLVTTMGEIDVTLDEQGAPRTAAHMLRLFNSGHYVGAAVFRIEPNFLIQLGDLDAALKHRWPPGGTVPLETARNRHFRGSVSLARGEATDSGQSTFYFDMAENSHLNADPAAPPDTTGYAAFGRVTRGMEVLEAMQAVERTPTGGPFPGKLPKVPIVITAVRTNRPEPPPRRAKPPATPAMPTAKRAPAPPAKAKARRPR
jgi:cyclophilin family peptidyl-prolyl cis-trans isomerase